MSRSKLINVHRDDYHPHNECGMDGCDRITFPLGPPSRENRPLVKDEPVELKKLPVEVQDLLWVCVRL